MLWCLITHRDNFAFTCYVKSCHNNATFKHIRNCERIERNKKITKYSLIDENLFASSPDIRVVLHLIMISELSMLHSYILYSLVLQVCCCQECTPKIKVPRKSRTHFWFGTNGYESWQYGLSRCYSLQLVLQQADKSISNRAVTN
jgi:hypothetical protein